MANIFISHRSDDKVEAERLAEVMRNNGHDVWLDVWEIGIGDSIVEKMNEGLEGLTYLILCYSKSGVTSPWMSREWFSTLARQMNGVEVKILPAILTEGDIPAILADIKYVDLVKDWNQGVMELLKAIK